MRGSVFGGLGFLALVLAGCSGQSQPAETAATPPPPPYEIHTLRDLIGVCRTAESDPYYASARGLCWGYASGVLDSHEVEAGRRGRRVCLPTGTPAPTRADAVNGLMTWADANPQDLDLAAPSGLMRYYEAQYPCGHHRPMRHRAAPAAPQAPAPMTPGQPPQQ